MHRLISSSGPLRTLLLGWMAVTAVAQSAITVPLDHWIYPALDDLRAHHLVSHQTSALKPWTVAECLRQAREARNRLMSHEFKTEDPKLAELLRKTIERIEDELMQWSSGRITLFSLYQRVGVLAGTPLQDGFHFGQTWSADFGRPIVRGAHGVSGVSATAGFGPAAFYFRGEARQHRALPLPDAAAISLMARLDGIPEDQFTPQPQRSATRVLEAYAALQWRNAVVSVGKQALRWGPTLDTPLSFSTNAEPTENARLSSASPFRLPVLSRWLGPVRMEIVLGKLGGHQHTWRPWFNAQKIVLLPSADVELGFTRWSIFWGEGHPITLRSLARNIFSAISPETNGGPFDRDDPGDRKGGFDFKWRLPGMLRGTTLYADSYSDDDASPIIAPRRAAVAGGLHLARLPWDRRNDLRLEFASTDPLGTSANLNYWNNQYRSGNTNLGYPLGSWAGRAGRVLSAWSGWRTNGDRRVLFGLQHLKVDPSFLPGGGTQTRGNVRAVWAMKKDWRVEGFFQVERHWLPVLGPRRFTASAWITVVYQPMLCLTGCQSELPGSKQK